MRPHALLLKFPGTNCDAETARALQAAGFEARILPFPLADREQLAETDLVVLAGGFSYGDYIMAARLAQIEIETRLGDALHRFRDTGGHLLGICNGFQILMRLGLLPEGSLIENRQGRFVCRWVRLRNRAPSSPFLSRLPETFELPIAHAEGRFVAAEAEVQRYLADGRAALTYEEDVNGSLGAIAGLQDETGRVFGLMPHPERFLTALDHPDRPPGTGDGPGSGYAFFAGIHDHIQAGRAETAGEASR